MTVVILHSLVGMSTLDHSQAIDNENEVHMVTVCMKVVFLLTEVQLQRKKTILNLKET